MSDDDYSALLDQWCALTLRLYTAACRHFGRSIPPSTFAAVIVQAISLRVPAATATIEATFKRQGN